MAETGRIALVAGGSGLVGGHLLRLLLDASDYARVYALSRRALPIDHPRFANRVVRFNAPLDAQLKGLTCQDAFCCIGTTLRQAGSQEAFRAVDHDLVVAFARFAHAAGAERLVLVSSVGADPASKSFYLGVKGETERALEALRFRDLEILQPSLLIGARREQRLVELLAQGALWAVGPLLLGNAARFRAVEATITAAAMLGAARAARRGVHRHTYEGIRRLASPKRSAAIVN